MVKLKLSFLIKLFWVSIYLAIPLSVRAAQMQGSFNIIPQPRKIELAGTGDLQFYDLKGILLDGDFKRPVMGGSLSSLPQRDKTGPGVVTLRLSNQSSLPESHQGYLLTVKDGKVEIISRGVAGLFYGCQTLEQLIEESRDTGRAIPACKITDYPALSYRAVHFDVKHHLDTMKYYYDSIDRLARYKINAVIFEFEDKLRYRRQKLVGGPLSVGIEEMAALTNYARERNIEISPLVQGLGHATFILKHEKYAYLREDPEKTWAFCPLHEGTYQMLFDLYRDAVEATPGSRYLHIGGDEVGQIGLCPRCKPTGDEKGVFELNLYWLNRVCEFAAELGRTPIFWDDMPFKYAGLWEAVHYDKLTDKQVARAWEKGEPILNKMLDRFPKNAVFMRWDYSPARQAGNIRALDWYKKSGVKCMIATAAQNMTPLLPYGQAPDEVHDRVEVIKSFVTIAAERGMDAMLCTAWDDASPHMETYWRPFIAAAEYSWSGDGRNLDEFEIAYLCREFGPECAGAVDLNIELYKAVKFWKNALPVDISRVADMGSLDDETSEADSEEKATAVPSLSSPGKWSKLHKERLSTAKQEARRYKKTSRLLEQMRQNARRNHYHLELLSVINDFQITAAHLLLALEKCDTAEAVKQKAGFKLVRESLAEFDTAWEQLKTVCAKTRFLSYPKSFVPDRYHHFASRREDFTWLIIAEEKYHAIVKDWLKENDR